ncbi:MAG: bile acid:sodium symporter family protein [Candidatus Hydrogenedentota bacterium]
MSRWVTRWTNGFVLWVILFSIAAYLIPESFTQLLPGIVPGLGVIMFGMGMTLVPEDLLRVSRMKRAVSCGVLGQFLLMPLLAFAIARVFRLSDEIAMGFIILGSCPGGTVSNVIAYLAKADVALSVTMTTCSTVLGVLLTPLLISTLGGEYLEVNATAMLLSVVKIVLIPVTAGFAIRYWFTDKVRRFLDVFPAISMLIIVLIIATIVALSKDKLPEVIGLLGVLVVVHNLLGMLAGYGLATLFRLPEAARRTVAIEVGMQNSGLGVTLATTHFASPLVALPSSLFSIVHNLTGSSLATYWARTSDSDDEKSR